MKMTTLSWKVVDSFSVLFQKRIDMIDIQNKTDLETIWKMELVKQTVTQLDIISNEILLTI